MSNLSSVLKEVYDVIDNTRDRKTLLRACSISVTKDNQLVVDGPTLAKLTSEYKKGQKGKGRISRSQLKNLAKLRLNTLLDLLKKEAGIGEGNEGIQEGQDKEA